MFYKEIWGRYAGDKLFITWLYPKTESVQCEILHEKRCVTISIAWSSGLLLNKRMHCGIIKTRE